MAGATSDEMEDSTELIKETLRSKPFIHAEDEIRSAKFMDNGRAHAVVRFSHCITTKQLQQLKDAELWELENVHPDGTTDDPSIRAHITEVLN